MECPSCTPGNEWDEWDNIEFVLAPVSLAVVYIRWSKEQPAVATHNGWQEVEGGMDPSQKELAYLENAIEFAPPAPPRPDDGLVGWETPTGWWLCVVCSGRITARGCQLPRASRPVYRDQNDSFTCCLCETFYRQGVRNGQMPPLQA